MSWAITKDRPRDQLVKAATTDAARGLVLVRLTQ
jgi:hypothetical protein